MAAAWPSTRIDGGLRTPLDAGEITGEDVFGVLPFNNTVDQVLLTGKAIRSVLEYNVATMCPNQTCEPIEFLQVAGLKVDFHIKKGNAGSRVANIDLIGKDGLLSPLSEVGEYPVAVTSFLLLPGKSPMYDLATDHKIGRTDYEVMVEYLEQHSPINQKREGRISVHYFLPRRS